MSRCFPYPPPGYVSNRATGDSSLIESIKRDTEKIKREKKEQKRRDKEQRKKEKKEKKREKEKSTQYIEGTNKRKRDDGGLDKSVCKSWVNSKGVDIQKKNQTEAEQLERSSLSEEHGLPVLTESLGYFSDGTQSKTKRIRIEQPPSNGNCTMQGKAVRIRLKRRENESIHSTDDIPSTSGRISSPLAPVFDALPVKEESCLGAPISVAAKNIKDALQVPMEQLFLGKTQAAHVSLDILPCSSSIAKGQKKPKSAYDALFSNWVPPLIQFEAVTGNDDEQWMFPCKKKPGQNRLSLECLNGVSGLSFSSMQPRAHLLPEADLYILPFTVPL